MDKGAQGGFDGGRVESEPCRSFAHGKGAVRAGIATNDFKNRCADRSKKSFRKTVGKFQAEGVAIAGSIFDREVAGPPGDFHGRRCAAQ